MRAGGRVGPNLALIFVLAGPGSSKFVPTSTNIGQTLANFGLNQQVACDNLLKLLLGVLSAQVLWWACTVSHRPLWGGTFEVSWGCPKLRDITLVAPSA